MAHSRIGASGPRQAVPVRFHPGDLEKREMINGSVAAVNVSRGTPSVFGTRLPSWPRSAGDVFPKK
jgi:hypothetical protein